MAEYPSVAALRHRLASHELGCLKPAAAIYRAADQVFAAGNGLVLPRVVFFDDLEENVAAAEEHGWLARRIDPRGEPTRQIATYLEELGID